MTTNDITNTEWDFDYNGSTFDADASGNTATHIYLTAGNRTVAIRVTDTTDVRRLHGPGPSRRSR